MAAGDTYKWKKVGFGSLKETSSSAMWHENGISESCKRELKSIFMAL